MERSCPAGITWCGCIARARKSSTEFGSYPRPARQVEDGWSFEQQRGRISMRLKKTSGGKRTKRAGMPRDMPESRTARQSKGRSLRSKCPRSSHSKAGLDYPKRDPLSLIEKSNGGRLENLLPVRFSRMLESPFAFFRGTAVVQAQDLYRTSSAGIIVQSCGDCHLLNFGGFASPERTLIFDINDFDETFPAPFEWDLKRLAASFVLAARWRNFGSAMRGTPQRKSCGHTAKRLPSSPG